MGPPIFIGGKLWNSKATSLQNKCFNGAADFYRRKEQNALQWIHERFGFNGAADFYRRKE